MERGSTAEKKYKELLERSRWIITSVNGKAIATPADFHREAAAAKGPLELKIVEVARNAEATAQTLTLPCKKWHVGHTFKRTVHAPTGTSRNVLPLKPSRSEGMDPDCDRDSLSRWDA